MQQEGLKRGRKKRIPVMEQVEYNRVFRFDCIFITRIGDTKCAENKVFIRLPVLQLTNVLNKGHKNYPTNGPV